MNNPDPIEFFTRQVIPKWSTEVSAYGEQWVHYTYESNTHLRFRMVGTTDLYWFLGEHSAGSCPVPRDKLVEIQAAIGRRRDADNQRRSDMFWEFAHDTF